MPECNVPQYFSTFADRELLSEWADDDDFIKHALYKYGIYAARADWAKGFGWDDLSNYKLPLVRTLNAIFMLIYSAPEPNDESEDQEIVFWARKLVRDNINYMTPACGTDNLAVSNDDLDYVRLYISFFYESTIMERAFTLVHEARHMEDVDHEANFPAGSSYGPGKGADIEWDDEGAWMYAASFAANFAYINPDATSAMRKAAVTDANIWIENCFHKTPDFRYKDYW